MGSYSLLQRIFLTQGSNPHLQPHMEDRIFLQEDRGDSGAEACSWWGTKLGPGVAFSRTRKAWAPWGRLRKDWKDNSRPGP